MADTMVHRGPDDAGVWESADGSAALSHRRLSIIDLSPLGRNPMSWDDGRLWITFNGEIYNFRELRKELEQAGYRFGSQTDTEVILAAYDRWGVESIARLVGMFAFAIWDTPRRRLWLVRDRLGKKPLYYAHGREMFSFASELKGILATGCEPDIDPDSIGLYLRYGYIPSPYTVFAGVKKLPPAHYLLLENDASSVTRYWDPMQFSHSAKALSETEAEAQLEGRLSLAVRQRMIADVPLGAFLSGGVDSSLVVALMQEQSGARARTFTIRFDNPEFNEADHAAAVARHLGTEHHEETCDDRQMLSVVDRLAGMFDEPFADSSAVPTYLVSKAAREHVTVALSGDGGDELFLGYPRYRYYAKADAVLALPRPVRRLAATIAAELPRRRGRRVADVLRGDDPDRYGRFIAWWQPDEVEALTGAAPIQAPAYTQALETTGGWDHASRAGMIDLVSYLPEDILTKVDRASMAVGLEVRAPLLDHRVVELALGLPTPFKQHRASTKVILRHILYRRVPRELIERPKMGFGVPLLEWFRGPLRERMTTYLEGHDLEEIGIRPAAVRRLWSDFQTGRTLRTDLLWQIFTLIAWARQVSRSPVAR